MASAMVDGLGQILGDNAGAEVIPRRVYSDAQDFFRLALEAAGDTLPTNPSASISNYIIAAGAAKALPQPSTDRAELQRRLQEYAIVVNQLQSGQNLAEHERRIAVTLKDFFAQVQREAEAEAYNRVVESDPLPISFRLL
jgi:hypothetical protein